MKNTRHHHLVVHNGRISKDAQTCTKTVLFTKLVGGKGTSSEGGGKTTLFG